MSSKKVADALQGAIGSGVSKGGLAGAIEKASNERRGGEARSTNLSAPHKSGEAKTSCER
jgi:hypothetical protein